MKKSLGLASLLLAGSLYGASEDAGKWYVGFGTTSGSGTQTREYSTGGSYSTEYDTSGSGIKIGKVLANENRFEFSINTIEAEYTEGNYFNANVTSGDTTSEFTGYDFDWLITIGENKKLLPYIDLGFGIYNNDEIRGYASGSNTEESATGFALNLGLGLISELTENIEIEGAYKTKSIGWNLANPDVSEDISYLYLGLNLKF